MTFASHIEPDEINALPHKAFEGRIHLVNTHEEADAAIRILMQEEILGFDTETKPSFKKGKINPVSLLQLSTRSDAFLFRVNRLGNHQGLCSLLGNGSVMKVGAAIRDDIRLLKKIFPCELNGFIDLQEVVKEYGIENFGVKKLAGIVLGIRISKSQQLSNWEALELTEAQQIYAATDAWVTLEVYLKLRQTVVK
jgi:ribonuclease D